MTSPSPDPVSSAPPEGIGHLKDEILKLGRLLRHAGVASDDARFAKECAELHGQIDYFWRTNFAHLLRVEGTPGLDTPTVITTSAAPDDAPVYFGAAPRCTYRGYAYRQCVFADGHRGEHHHPDGLKHGSDAK